MQRSLRSYPLLVLSLALSIFVVSPAGAEDSAALKGKRVVVIHDKAPLAVKGQPAGTVAECSVFTVDDVNGNWLWIASQKAFLNSVDVIPFDDAISYYTRLLDANSSALNYERRATIWRMKGELDLAIADLSEAIRLNPNRPRSYGDRGLMWHNKQEYDRAISDFTNAIRLEPRAGGHYHNRARSWRKKKNYDQALADHDEALRLTNPNEKTRVFADTDVAGEDSSQMINALSLRYFVRGFTWEGAGNLEKALQDYNEAIRRDPKHEKARLFRRALWQEMQAWDKIIADCEATLASDPQDANALNAFARLRATCPEAKYRNGRTAVEYAQKACELRNWKTADFLDTLAAAYAEAGDFDKAITWEQKAIGRAKATAIAEFETRLKLYREHRPFYFRPTPR